MNVPNGRSICPLRSVGMVDRVDTVGMAGGAVGGRGRHGNPQGKVLLIPGMSVPNGLSVRSVLEKCSYQACASLIMLPDPPDRSVEKFSSQARTCPIAWSAVCTSVSLIRSVGLLPTLLVRETF